MASVIPRHGKNGTSYRIVVSCGYHKNGDKKTEGTTFNPDPSMTERKALKAAHKFGHDFEQQIKQGFAVSDKQTFSEFADYVLKLKKRQGSKHSTEERYQALLIRINHAIGHIKLKDIRPHHLNSFYENLAEEGVRMDSGRALAIVDLNSLLKKRGLPKCKVAELSGISSSTIGATCSGKPINIASATAIANSLGKKVETLFHIEQNQASLSEKTILEHHRLISTILTQAEKEMIVPYNAASKATPPKAKRKIPNYYQPEQVMSILKKLEQQPLKWQLITQLLIFSGARRGEIVGLRWSKIDFTKRRILIDTALLYSCTKGVYAEITKTDNSRYVPIPEETLSLLRRYRAEQSELRLAWGERWVDSGFVFTQEKGEPMNPDSVTGWLSDFSKRHDLPHINPHAFRHSAASVLFSQGTDMVTVSKMLGHAKVSTTIDIYSHLIESAKEEAGNALSSAYFGTQKK